MKVITAPFSLNSIIRSNWPPSVFLGGTIDNGNSEDWQSLVINQFQQYEVVILNPRRADWNSALDPVLETPDFRQQVDWEMEALTNADWKLFYFAPNSRSPVSMMELGLFASSGATRVACPKSFWRRGNVEFICQHYNIPFYETLSDLVDDLKIEVENTINPLTGLSLGNHRQLKELRQNLGEILTAELSTPERNSGTHKFDWFDSREMDTLLDRIMPPIATHLAQLMRKS